MKNILLVILLFSISGCKHDIKTDSLNEALNDYYGVLIIPSLDMTYGFYDLDNKLNNISKNVTLISSNIPNTYILAAHSGNGTNAYFESLKFLKESDEVYLKFKDKTLEYIVKNIRSETKNGKIRIKREENQVILTTCDQLKKGNQLIIEASLKS